jgi:hypothetical protein
MLVAGVIVVIVEAGPEGRDSGRVEWPGKVLALLERRRDVADRREGRLDVAGRRPAVTAILEAGKRRRELGAADGRRLRERELERIDLSRQLGPGREGLGREDRPERAWLL